MISKDQITTGFQRAVLREGPRQCHCKTVGGKRVQNPACPVHPTAVAPGPAKPAPLAEPAPEKPLLSFTLWMAPKSTQFGARMGVRNGKRVIYTDKRKAAYLARVAGLALQFVPSRPLVGPLRVDFVFVSQRPKAMMGAKHPDGLIYSTGRPDRDNYQKGTQDGLKAFWQDDAQICDGRTAKYHAEKNGSPRIEVTIYSL